MTIRYFLSWCLLTTAVVGCSGSGSASVGDGVTPTGGSAGGGSPSGGSPGGGGAIGGGDVPVAPNGSPEGAQDAEAIVDAAPGEPETPSEPTQPLPLDASTTGVSKCGAPLDAVAPTTASIGKDGPLAVTSYSKGLPSSPAYKSLTVHYPTKGTGPYVVVMISPGLTEVLQYLQQWARRFASYNYVAVFVEANDTNNDSEATRATGLWAAIQTMRAEGTRTGSPLAGKLSDCIVTTGHSLGGGASISVANAHPTAIKAALGFNPYDPSTIFSSIVAPTLIITGQSDSTAGPTQHGRRQYDSMSSKIAKQYVEVANGNHQSALFPGTLPGRYAVAWVKLTVDGDERYRPLLAKATSGLSSFATTLPQ